MGVSTVVLKPSKPRTPSFLTSLVTDARKTLVALIAALATFGTELSTGPMTTSKWIVVGIAFLGAFGVHQTTNVTGE